MRRQVIKITAISMLSVVLAAAVVVAAFYVRLSQGPVSLDFMTGTIMGQINKNLTGMSVDIDGAMVERDATTGVPPFPAEQHHAPRYPGQHDRQGSQGGGRHRRGAIFSGSLCHARWTSSAPASSLRVNSMARSSWVSVILLAMETPPPMPAGSSRGNHSGRGQDRSAAGRANRWWL